ncbi:MAG: arginine--tRNA ligase [Planctomycetes bacterium]|nr:arginine--tRNA ligase [Planctomycetota bacterium]
MLLAHLADLARSAITLAYGVSPTQVAIEFPEDRARGDLTVNAFLLAKELRIAPPKLAATLAAALNGCSPVDTAVAVSGYVNLKLQPEALLTALLQEVLDDPTAFGQGTALAGRRLMVEYSAPNTNKPLHLGHMRNNFLGHSTAAVLANAGATVLRANLFNDRGIHICKSMLAWKRFMNGVTPTDTGQKSDHLVGDCYVRFDKEFAREVETHCAAHPEEFEVWKTQRLAQKDAPKADDAALAREWRASFREAGFAQIPLGAECTEMLRAWERGDTEVHALWNLMNGWAFAGFAKTYTDLGVSFDVVYRESETWTLGRDLILEGLERGVFQRRADGAVEIDLSAEKLGRKVVLRSDGTSVYITQDIGTTVLKAAQNQLDGQLWVVGDEQKYHFAVLFAILRHMGYAWASDLHHLAYGLVNLPEGRMKSREGTVVDADDLLAETTALAVLEIRARDEEHRLEDAEVQRRAAVVALSALRFMLLKVNPLASMTFDPKESVKFDGDTGARVLYAYARLRSMLDAAGTLSRGNPALLNDPAEINLALTLLALPAAAARAAREYNPGVVANWLLELVRDLNRFYDRCDVLRATDQELRAARLQLCAAAVAGLERGTALLGMPLLQRM